MNKLKHIVFTIIVLFPLTISAETTLTASSVEVFLEDLQKAVRAKDAERFASYLTDDIVIILEVPGMHGGVTELNKNQYKMMLAQGWAMPAVYTYEVKNIDIQISKDKKTAIVTDLTLETVQMNGQVMASTSANETLNVTISGGVPKLERIHAKIQFLKP